MVFVSQHFNKIDINTFLHVVIVYNMDYIDFQQVYMFLCNLMDLLVELNSIYIKITQIAFFIFVYLNDNVINLNLRVTCSELSNVTHPTH